MTVSNNPLIMGLNARMGEHLADVRTLNAYKTLRWISTSRSIEQWTDRLEASKDKSLEIIMTRPYGTEPAEEILSACEDLLYLIGRS